MQKKNYGLMKPEEMKDFGSNLLKAAEDAAQADRGAKMVGQIRMMVDHLHNLEVQKDKIDIEIKLFENRLKAINDGEFILDLDNRVIYKDKRLR